MSKIDFASCKLIRLSLLKANKIFSKNAYSSFLNWYKFIVLFVLEHTKQKSSSFWCFVFYFIIEYCSFFDHLLTSSFTKFCSVGCKFSITKTLPNQILWWFTFNVHSFIKSNNSLKWCRRFHKFKYFRLKMYLHFELAIVRN